MCAATNEDEQAVSTLATGPCSPNVKPMRPLATLCEALVNAKPPAQQSHFSLCRAATCAENPGWLQHEVLEAGSHQPRAEKIMHLTCVYAVLTTQCTIVARPNANVCAYHATSNSRDAV